MTIRRLADVPHEDLPGKFICTPAQQLDLAHGWPARIEKATRARIAYRRLPRGAWDETQKEWQVALTPQRSQPGAAPAGDLAEPRCDERSEQCVLDNVRFACDTAEEAIALYVQAVITQKHITAMRKAALSGLNAQALAGELPVPTYLVAQQA
jgi:hypothetical protein